MTMAKVVETLRREGHHVEYYTRPDGGIRVTQVDNRKFNAARSEGNNFARAVATQETGRDVKLSQTAREQRAFNRANRIVTQKQIDKNIEAVKYQGEAGLEKIITKRVKLPQATKNKIKQIQRLWRQNGLSGSVTTKKYRWRLEHKGKASADEYLENMLRRAKKLVNSASIDSIIQNMRLYNELNDNDPRFEEALDRLEDAKDTVTQSQFEDLRDNYYEVSKGTVAIGVLIDVINAIVDQNTAKEA